MRVFFVMVSTGYFVIAVLGSSFSASELLHMTFIMIIAIAFTLKNPILTLFYGIAMVLIYFLNDIHNPINLGNAIGTVFFTIISAVCIFLIKQISQERDNYYKASVTDTLTGLYSFAYILQSGQAMLHSGLKVRTLLIDVDRFKQINDTYGHLVGNKVLVFLADLLQKAGSPMNGIVGRLGGDDCFRQIFFTSLLLKNQHCNEGTKMGIPLGCSFYLWTSFKLIK